MEHDSREKTYANLIIKKKIQPYFGWCFHCVNETACLELELINGDDGDDKAKWEHLVSSLDFNTSSLSLQFYNIATFVWIKQTNNEVNLCIMCILCHTGPITP